MEGAKKLTDVFIPQGPVDVSNSKQICVSCNQFEIGGKEYALIDISKKIIYVFGGEQKFVGSATVVGMFRGRIQKQVI